MGRPAKGDDKRGITVAVRITPADARALDEYCAEHGIGRGEAAYTALLRLLCRDGEKPEHSES